MVPKFVALVGFKKYKGRVKRIACSYTGKTRTNFNMFSITYFTAEITAFDLMLILLTIFKCTVNFGDKSWMGSNLKYRKIFKCMFFISLIQYSNVLFLFFFYWISCSILFDLQVIVLCDRMPINR